MVDQYFIEKTLKMLVTFCANCFAVVIDTVPYRYGLFGMNLVSAVLTVRKTYGRWYILSVFSIQIIRQNGLR